MHEQSEVRRIDAPKPKPENQNPRVHTPICARPLTVAFFALRPSPALLGAVGRFLLASRGVGFKAVQAYCESKIGYPEYSLTNSMPQTTTLTKGLQFSLSVDRHRRSRGWRSGHRAQSLFFRPAMDDQQIQNPTVPSSLHSWHSLCLGKGASGLVGEHANSNQHLSKLQYPTGFEKLSGRESARTLRLHFFGRFQQHQPYVFVQLQLRWDVIPACNSWLSYYSSIRPPVTIPV